jgi:hypothetical protein
MTVSTSPHPSPPGRLRAKRGTKALVAQYIRDLSSREGGRSYEHGPQRRRDRDVKERG